MQEKYKSPIGLMNLEIVTQSPLSVSIVETDISVVFESFDASLDNLDHFIDVCTRSLGRDKVVTYLKNRFDLGTDEDFQKKEE